MYLVTGGAGFIGSNFLHYISKDTDLIEPVIVIDNLSYAADQKFIPDTDQLIFEWCDTVSYTHLTLPTNREV